MGKRKSDYAIVLSCNPGYGFGMISTMNAQNYFKTDADWEIAYEDYTREDRDKISNAFSFNVNWTPISDLMSGVRDRRTDQSSPLNRFWLAYWLLAYKLLMEKKYKSVCVIQADQFVFINLDPYFKIAESGVMCSTEYAFTAINAEDLPFGDDTAIWDRCMCGIFDGVNFLGQPHAQIAMDTVHYQEEDAFRGEANHSVIALNRSACKHLTRGNILRLDRHTWMCDSSWHVSPFREFNSRVYNAQNIQINGWHCRWWQVGRVRGEWGYHGPRSKNDHPDLDILDNNIVFIKSFMERFNNMIPDIKSEIYEKGSVARSVVTI